MFDELVRRAKSGDEKVLGEIVETLQPLLVSSIRRYYDKSKEYEDLMQDGNMKIIESINDFDEAKGVHFLGYVKMNIKYLYLDKHKQRFHQSLDEKVGDGEMEMLDLLVSDEIDFLEGIIEGEDRLELRRALGVLTQRQRLIIDMFYGRNMSIGDIADELGVAYRTVINTRTRALEKMGKVLKIKE